VDSQLTELRNMQQTRNDLFQGVIALPEETSEMIRGCRPNERERPLTTHLCRLSVQRYHLGPGLDFVEIIRP